MNDEALRRAQELLLELLSSQTEPMDPSVLLAAAAKQSPHPPAEHLRIALWSLLSSGDVVRSDDNSLMRGKRAARTERASSHPSRPREAGC